MIHLVSPPPSSHNINPILLSSRSRVALSNCKRSSSNDEIPLLRSPPKWNNTKELRIKLKQPKTTNKVTTTDILELMDSLHLSIPTQIYTSLLKECTNLRDASTGSLLHAHINQTSNNQPSLLLLNRLLIMYVGCDRLHDARQLFERMPVRDSISWATMIAGHVDNHQPLEALVLFDQMCQTELFSALTVPSVLKACIQTSDFVLGRQLHGWVVKNINCNATNDAVSIWNLMIVLYCNEDRFDEGFELFKEMGRSGIENNASTFSSVIQACGRMRDRGRCGKQVHACTIKYGGVESDVFVQASLVEMYAKFGLLKDARLVFEMISMKKRNAACWNAMLTGYTRHKQCNEAIQLLYQMRAAGVQPSESMLK